LKNPLGTILGYVWLLREEPGLSEQHKEYVESIHDSVKRMQRLVTNLLDLAKIESGIDSERELCSVESIVSEIFDEFIRRADLKHIQLLTRLENGLAPINVNRLRMVQALGNLVSNAIKYTPDGGTVTIAVQQDGEGTTLSVSDTGPGISLADQALLFNKFARVGTGLACETTGTGLGLAIVRSAVESHGGRVWLDSQTGQGSTFYFRLPQ